MISSTAMTASRFPVNRGAPGANPPWSRLHPHQGDIVDFYEDALFKIPGVDSIGFSNHGSDQAITVGTRSPEAAAFVGALLEPRIDGIPVQVREAPTPAHEPQFQFSGADSVVARYGDALKGIQHVTGVRGESSNGHEKLVVSTDSKEAAVALDRLIADKIHGVPVQFKAPNARHDPSVNAWGWSSWD